MIQDETVQKKLALTDVPSLPHNTLRLHCVAVILAGDITSSNIFIEDAVIAATMSVLHFVGAAAAGKGDQLMSHADTENRH